MNPLEKDPEDQSLVALSGWPVLLVALLAVYWPVRIRLEGNLALFATVGTNCIMHLSWASAEATTSFSIHGIHYTLAGEHKKRQWYKSVWMAGSVASVGVRLWWCKYGGE